MRSFLKGGLEQKLGKISSIIALTGALAFSGGCGSMSVGPARVYALHCAWCGQSIASGEYTEFNDGLVLRSIGSANIFGDRDGLKIGNTKQDNFNEIVTRDLVSVGGGIYYKGKIYCSERCASEANKQYEK